jgi:hypothetical protein
MMEEASARKSKQWRAHDTFHEMIVKDDMISADRQHMPAKPFR